MKKLTNEEILKANNIQWDVLKETRPLLAFNILKAMSQAVKQRDEEIKELRDHYRNLPFNEVSVLTVLCRLDEILKGE